jgi:hypothetical protein
METKLARIAEMAKADSKVKFTSIGHFIDAEALTESHKEMKPGKATGVDGVTKETTEAEKLQTATGQKNLHPQG